MKQLDGLIELGDTLRVRGIGQDYDYIIIEHTTVHCDIPYAYASLYCPKQEYVSRPMTRVNLQRAIGGAKRISMILVEKKIREYDDW